MSNTSLHMCSHCGGFSCCEAQALGTQASVVVARGLRCSAACGIPRSGLEPVSPALAGGFLTTAPPGKSLISFDICVYQPGKFPHAPPTHSLNPPLPEATTILISFTIDYFGLFLSSYKWMPFCVWFFAFNIIH